MFPRRASSEFQFGALREVVARERQRILIVTESLVERRSTRKGVAACTNVG